MLDYVIRLLIIFLSLHFRCMHCCGQLMRLTVHLVHHAIYTCTEFQ